MHRFRLKNLNKKIEVSFLFIVTKNSLRGRPQAHVDKQNLKTKWRVTLTLNQTSEPIYECNCKYVIVLLLLLHISKYELIPVFMISSINFVEWKMLMLDIMNQYLNRSIPDSYFSCL
jgi:hypothetical protein